MNILDLHVNCHVALHPKQLDNFESNHRNGFKSNSILRDSSLQSSITSNMDYEESAFKYQPYKRSSTNDMDSSFQNSSFYNVYDKWHYYSVNPSERYSTNEHHNSIIPFGHASYQDQSTSNSYMDVGYRRYTSDLYGQMYDQPLPDSGFYPYTSNLNPYLNFCDNNYQQSTAYYQQKPRYPQNGYQHDGELGSLCERKTDISSHWYALPPSKTAPGSSRDLCYNYDTHPNNCATGHSEQKQNNYSDKSSKVVSVPHNHEQKLGTQYGKCNRLSGPSKGPSNFTIHVRKQERKLKKRLKDLQSKNCEKATQLLEYYHYKVIMIEKQARQRHQQDSSSDNSEETDVQILQLVHEMEERINALQFTMNEETPEKYMCSDVRKTRLLPKHAIKTLENWYDENLSNPYPSRDQTVRLALDCALTIEQVRKWFANKRNRSRNNKLHLMK